MSPVSGEGLHAGRQATNRGSVTAVLVIIISVTDMMVLGQLITGVAELH